MKALNHRVIYMLTRVKHITCQDSKMIELQALLLGKKKSLNVCVCLSL